jgi:hypothetical protein
MTMNKFTAEEINLVSIYHAEDRETTLQEIAAALPLMDEDMSMIAGAAIEKIKAMTEEEYRSLSFDFADETA